MFEYSISDEVQIQSKVTQDLPGDAVRLAHQPESEMFRANVILLQVPRLFVGVFDGLLGPRSLGSCLETISGPRSTSFSTSERT